ncbi:hypothetical protein BD309DRAFT_663721 [Dichomitus squalens]|uniref:Mitochondrial ribosomal protein L27-domain-containing protein n=1 Tax=Dichomitus squalens TaxID=114155 RepID=A0A4Q9P0D0_9APHY|nr:hypothetical protein BD311DRAFT_729293 [Dichomitus squalens]TBU46072.1 hypothetical protein BD309DRAFT_663721 [Dichomitus squalens]TBU60297.1 hypothetical protein BD310DRAFT_923216 [Dichomitus squalens]
MFPTNPVLSKALRRALTPKRGNKDYYKGTRQAFLPGGHRTGAPGKHVVRGKAKYRLVDEQVRVFVAPPIEEIQASALKPYVSTQVRVSPKDLNEELYGKLPRGGLTGQHFFNIATRSSERAGASSRASS